MRPNLASLGTKVSSSIKIGLGEGGANGTKGLATSPTPSGCGRKVAAWAFCNRMIWAQISVLLVTVLTKSKSFP